MIMTQRIVIDPVTRIEGHAKISIFMDDAGNVSDAEFHVVEFRGFEKFCEGRPYSEMPGITPRICGICPVSHLLASAKAGDAIMAVNIPPAADKLRRLMNLGQIIQSHALSFFHLSAPDFLLGWDTPQAKRNVFGLIAANTDLARAGIRLRQFGQEIIAVLGGQKIHPAWAVPGGVRSPLTEEGRARIRAWLPEAYATTKIAFDLFKKTLDTHKKEIQIFGNFPSLFMGLVEPDGTWEHHGGKLRFTDSSGSIIADQLDPQKYYEYIGESVQSSSYLKSPYYSPLGFPDGMYRVGPLARLNVAEQMGTPKADAELKKFKKLGRGRSAVTSSFLYHYARLIEILAVDRAGGSRHGRRGPAQRRPARRCRHQQPPRRGRQRSPARHALPRLHRGPRRPAAEGQPHRRHGPEQPGDEPDRRPDRAALRARQQDSRAHAQPRRARHPLLRSVPELLHARRGADAAARPAHRAGRHGAERSRARLRRAALTD